MNDLVSITSSELPVLPRRQRDAHKGNFGKILVIGGSRRMVGAPALAANGALRGGAGLVTVAAPANVQLSVAGLCPCATTLPLAIDTNNILAPQSIAQMKKAIDAADFIVAGPGMAIGMQQQQLIRAVIQQEKPVLLDADGLNNLSQINEWYDMRKCPLVLTPHPGEFAKLTDQPTPADAESRKSIAVVEATKWKGGCELPLVLALKGAGTVVTDAKHIFVNETGNPGMATGGSGDVLSGLIAGLAMQGISLFEAVCLGVCIHGMAGDIAAGELTEQSLIACDLLEYIPKAMKNFTENE